MLVIPPDAPAGSRTPAEGVTVHPCARNDAERFAWTRASEEAARLLAEGERTFLEVAKAVGVHRNTLALWRQHPEFAGRVEGLVAECREQARWLAVGNVLRRVDRLNRDWIRLQRVVDARAADPSMRDVPGGPTGLLVRETKGVGTGEHFRLVETYRVDAALLRELREIEAQAARELGQWAEKTDHSGGLTIKVEYEEAERTVEAIYGPCEADEGVDRADPGLSSEQESSAAADRPRDRSKARPGAGRVWSRCDPRRGSARHVAVSAPGRWRGETSPQRNRAGAVACM